MTLEGQLLHSHRPENVNGHFGVNFRMKTSTPPSSRANGGYAMVTLGEPQSR